MGKELALFNGKTLAVFIIVGVLGYMAGSSMVGGHDHHDGDSDVLTSLDILPSPKPSINFDLPSLSGGNISLEGLRGKWVLINFWARWCGPCVLEMPLMNRMYEKLKGKPFEILAINVENVSKEKIQQFVTDLELTFPILLDSDKSIARKYEVVGLPYSALVNPEGDIVGIAYGMREWDKPEMVGYFMDLMKNGP